MYGLSNRSIHSSTPIPKPHTPGITSSTIKEDDPLALMGEQLLYIPESSLSQMISIGEGKPIIRGHNELLNCTEPHALCRAIWVCVQGIPAHWKWKDRGSCEDNQKI